MIRVGDMLSGYCGGCFGESYGNKVVEGIGPDWIVVREGREVLMLAGDEKRTLENHIDEHPEELRSSVPCWEGP